MQPDRQDIQLHSFELLGSVLAVIAFSIDISRNVIDFTLALLDSSIELHGVIGGMTESLLEVGDLT